MTGADKGWSSERIRAFYKSPQWVHCRAAYRFAHPFCAECQRNGKMRSMEDVDHIVPLSRGGAPLDPKNLQSLCRKCHLAKTAAESRKRPTRDPRGKRFMNRREKMPQGLVGFNMDGTAALESKKRARR